MRFTPWHHITGIAALAFVVSMFFGYSICNDNAECISPFEGSIDNLTQEDVQSRLIRGRSSIRGQRAAVRIASRVQPSPVVPTPAPSLVLPKGVRLQAVGRGDVLPEDREAIIKALSVFQNFDGIRTTIFVHYGALGDANLGRGVRAFVSDLGKVMFVRSMHDSSAYFRNLENDKFLEHELMHVGHDQVWSSSDRRIASALFSSLQSKSLSEYGKKDVYEFVAENGLVLYLDSVEAFYALFPGDSDFLRVLESFGISDLFSRKLQREYEYPVKDATRLQ